MKSICTIAFLPLGGAERSFCFGVLRPFFTLVVSCGVCIALFARFLAYSPCTPYSTEGAISIAGYTVERFGIPSDLRREFATDPQVWHRDTAVWCQKPRFNGGAKRGMWKNLRDNQPPSRKRVAQLCGTLPLA